MSRYSIFGEKEIVAKSQLVRIYGTDDNTFTYNDKRILTEGDLIDVGPIGSTPNANGLSLTNGVLIGQPANNTFGGFVTANAQTFKGSKTFADQVWMENGLNVFFGDTTTGNISVGELLANSTSTFNGSMVSAGLRNAASSTTDPKFITILGDGSFNNFRPIFDQAVVVFTNGSAAIPPAAPTVMDIASITAGTTGIIADTTNNYIAMTAPGLYFFHVGIQLDAPPANSQAQMQMLMRQADAPGGPWGPYESFQVGMQYPWTGLEYPYNFSFNYCKTDTAAKYFRWEVHGDCFDTTTGAPVGTSPSWNTGTKACRIFFIASPTVIP